VAVVQTFHTLGTVEHRRQPEAGTSPGRRIGYERVLGRQVDQVIAQCHEELRELLAMGVPRGSITVVPSGVDTTRFTPRGPAADRDAQPHRLVTVGDRVDGRGLADVVRALPRIPGTEVVLLGRPRGTVVSRLLRLAGLLRVEDRVRIVDADPVEDLPGWYRSADAVVCPGGYEASGLTALEAMACGVPVVAYALGGYPDTVVDGVTGQLVRPGDATALGDALRGLLSDPFRRMQYSSAAVDRTHRVYTWTRTAQRLLTLYQQVSREPQRDIAAARG
jgi:glycosyltransferase involved in cell wall biosynthesis